MPEYPRRFHLQRDVDQSGISGTGLVAAGTQYQDGVCTLRWLTEWPTSVGYYDRGIASVYELHGHGGATRIMWLDDDSGHELNEPVEYEPGDSDAVASSMVPAWKCDVLRGEIADLRTLLREANERAEESALRSIESRNPGIDMDEVRRQRGSTIT